MKILRALLLVVLVTPALVVLSATQALACSCIPQPPDEAALKDATAVFSGTVSEIEEGADIGFDRVTWTFAVTDVYKGDVAESQEVTSHTQSAACGLAFKEEKRYVIFAYDNKGELDTNSCMNTRPLSEGKDLKLEPIATFEKTEGMGPGGAEAEPAESGGWDPIAVGALGLLAVTAIVAVGLAIARGRSS